MQCSDLSSNISGIFFLFKVCIRQLINLIAESHREEDVYLSSRTPGRYASPPAPKRVIVLPDTSPCGAGVYPGPV